jgi:hypothetical protein
MVVLSVLKYFGCESGTDPECIVTSVSKDDNSMILVVGARSAEGIYMSMHVLDLWILLTYDEPFKFFL